MSLGSQDLQSSKVYRLAGMADATGKPLQKLTGATERFSALLEQEGYAAIDTPVVEETELFVRKSGGELTSRLYTLVDPGGHRVSLRPEFTPSVIRHYIQERAGFNGPVRFRYSGPVFRYEQHGVGAYRQFTQAGAELIGAAGAQADAEALSIAWEGLRSIGVTGFGIRIGNIGVLQELIGGFGLSEAGRLFIISNIQAIKTGQTTLSKLTEQAARVGLLRAGLKITVDDSAAYIDGDSTRDFIEGVLGEAMSSPTGRRTPEQIVDRLLRKVREASQPGNLESALALIDQLARIDGAPGAAIDRAGVVLKSHGIDASPLDDLSALANDLRKRGIDDACLTLDFGLARGISYYTGMIFEVEHPQAAAGASLGGGGRYDGLVRALGGEDVPALGFALTMDNVVDLLK